MTLPIKSFDQLVTDQVTAIQASPSQLQDFTIGSILRAVVESNAGNSLWLEAVATELLAVTRLGTSFGNDVDTFINPFGLFRLPAVSAVGDVVFFRFTPSAQAVVPAMVGGVLGTGTQVSASTANETYSVVADTTNIYYDLSLNAYLIPAGTAQISIPVMANTPGAAGNVLPNLINTLNSVIIGVDTVNNPAAMVTGADQESDAAFKARFIAYLNSLSKATYLALVAAIEGVEGVARFQLVENVDFPSGNQHLGFFYAVIDDGTGNPPPSLLASVGTALNNTRGFTIAYAVYPPIPLTVTVIMTLTLSPGSNQTTVSANVKNALSAYINSVGFGATLPYTKISDVAYRADSAVINVTNILLNGGTSDLVPGNGVLFQTDTSQITINF